MGLWVRGLVGGGGRRRGSGLGGEESFWTLAVTREVRREMMAGLGRGCIEAF